MDERCYGAEEIGEILKLDGADPRRRHIESCPRCAKLASAYRDFLDGKGKFPGPDLAGAREKIRRAIAGDDEVGIPLTLRRKAGKDGVKKRLAQPILLTGAVLVLVWALIQVCDREPPEKDIFETIASPPLESTDPLAPHTPVPVDKGVRLSWTGAPGATSYGVIVFSEVMKEIFRADRLTETECVVQRDDLPGRSKGKTFYWRVEMKKADGGIGLSPVAVFTMP